jgi:hypothetical protein
MKQNVKYTTLVLTVSVLLLSLTPITYVFAKRPSPEGDKVNLLFPILAGEDIVLPVDEPFWIAHGFASPGLWKDMLGKEKRDYMASLFKLSINGEPVKLRKWVHTFDDGDGFVKELWWFVAFDAYEFEVGIPYEFTAEWIYPDPALSYSGTVTVTFVE